MQRNTNSNLVITRSMTKNQRSTETNPPKKVDKPATVVQASQKKRKTEVIATDKPQQITNQHNQINSNTEDEQYLVCNETLNFKRPKKNDDFNYLEQSHEVSDFFSAADLGINQPDQIFPASLNENPNMFFYQDSKIISERVRFEDIRAQNSAFEDSVLNSYTRR